MDLASSCPEDLRQLENAASPTVSSCDTKFQALQRKVVDFLADWCASGEKNFKPYGADLPDLVHLLQALGFVNRHTDVTDGVTPLPQKKEGVRVVVTCGHSGRRFILERPLVELECRCKAVQFSPDIKITSSTSQARYKDDMGKALIPRISDEVLQVLRSVTNAMLHLLNDSKIVKDPKPALEVIAALIRENKKPIIARRSFLRAGRTVDRSWPSPAWRPVDSQSIVGIPSLGRLNREQFVEHARVMSIEQTKKKEPKAVSLLKETISKLQAALAIIEADSEQYVLYLPVVEEPPKESEVGEKKPSAPPARTVSSPNLMKLPPGSGQSKPKSTHRTQSSTNIRAKDADPSPQRELKSTLKRAGSGRGRHPGPTKLSVPPAPTAAVASAAAPPALGKRKDLYAHVRSTIPKPTPTKKH